MQHNKLTILLLIAYWVSGCGIINRDTPHDDQEVSVYSEVEALHAHLLQEAHQNFVDGFPSVTDCDMGKFYGIFAAGAAGSDFPINLEALEYPEDGKINRRPYEKCYPNDQNGDGRPDSRSTVSNDIIIGVMLGAFHQGNKELPRRILKYANDHHNLMGEPLSRPAEVILKPNVRVVLQGIVNGDRQFTVYIETTEDYARQLQTELILLEGSVFGDIPEHASDLLSAHQRAYPDDYYFKVAKAIYHGNLEAAARYFLSTDYHPSYVRGDRADNYLLAHRLWTAKLIMMYTK